MQVLDPWAEKESSDLDHNEGAQTVDAEKEKPGGLLTVQEEGTQPLINGEKVDQSEQLEVFVILRSQEGFPSR